MPDLDRRPFRFAIHTKNAAVRRLEESPIRGTSHRIRVELA